MTTPRQPRFVADSRFSLVLVIGFCGSLVSCSVLNKKEPYVRAEKLLDPAPRQPVLNEGTISNLKRIADSEAATLPEEPKKKPSEEIVKVDTPAPAEPAGPGKAWKRPGLDPSTIFPGDVFFANAGPYLNKTISLVDPIPSGSREEVLNSISKMETKRVPVTISQAELSEMRAAVGPDASLPGRSVALDMRVKTRIADTSKLEATLSNLSNDRISDAKARLQRGEQLYAIVSVSESAEVEATYPGAPLGKRDVELIENAVSALYPHLDSIKARKEGDKVVVTRPPALYWEFDVREVTLQGDKLVIEGSSLSQN